MPVAAEFQQRLKAIEQLLGEIETAADPSLRAGVQQLMQLVMDLHGAAFERMLEMIRAGGPEGEQTVARLGGDELVSSLLVLYGLHPETLEARVGKALEKARTRLRAHEGQVELLSLEDGAVRLRIEAHGHGCGSTAQALKEIVEEMMCQGAPDLTAVTIEGAEEKQGFVPLEALLTGTPLAAVEEGSR